MKGALITEFNSMLVMRRCGAPHISLINLPSQPAVVRTSSTAGDAALTSAHPANPSLHLLLLPASCWQGQETRH